MLQRFKNRLRDFTSNNGQAVLRPRSGPVTFYANNNMNAGHDINIYTVTGNLTVSKDETLLIRLRTALSPVATARHDSYESKNRDECFPNTRVQVLNDIEAWIAVGSDTPSIYILDGVAGIGKSTIAQTIAVKAAKVGLLGASFFFSRNEDIRMVAKDFFPTIAYQLGCYDNQFASRIIHALKKDPEAPGKRLQQQFSLLLQEPLQDLISQKDKPTLIVIDALDECEAKDAEQLLSLLGNCAQISGLKFLITTRPERHLRRILDQDRNHKRFRLHEIDNSVAHADIRLYLHSRLSVDEIRQVFPNLRKPWQPSASDMNTLCGICGTLFIIAATAIKFILDSHSSPQKQLNHLLNGVSPDDFTGSKHTDVLDATYLRIIFSSQAELDKIDDDWFGSLNKILGALITLANPLPCEALAVLLEMDADDLEAVLSSLHSLVAPSIHGTDVTFRIHHQSFPDFVTDRERIQRALRSCQLTMRPDMDDLLWIDVDKHDLQLAKACFNVMDRNLRWNIANIEKASYWKDKKDLPHVVPELISKEMAYAVMHWASHLLSSRKLGADPELQEYLDCWTFRHILCWIEVMVILDRVKETLNILNNAIESVKTMTDSAAWPRKAAVKELLSDASRFIQQGSELMKLSPIHVYRSCIPFLPSNTALYCTYGAEAALQVEMERCAQWEPLLVTCIGHSKAVHSVIFSADGSQLASGSSDNTIRVWDVKTGAHIQTLIGHSDSVWSVAFSSTGSRLASGSADKTLRLWDVKTGRHIHTLSGHSGRVWSIAFSKDNSQLASGSADNTIRLWDAKTSIHIVTLIGHSDWVTSIGFSNDGSRIVSGSVDKTIKTWDPMTGVNILTIVGHSDWVNSVVFSNNGSQLASGSSDNTIRLWDSTTGAQVHIFVGHTRWIHSVTFSSDGLNLASGSSDNTVRVWDTVTGAYISTLSGHSDEVLSVAFSTDSSLLASASKDGTVRLWSTELGAHQASQPTSSRHSDSVSSVAFSEDGTRLASGSYDNTIRLWNPKTGVHISTFTGHSDWVRLIAFSGDGSRLASGSDDRTIRLWNVNTAEHIFTLIGHSHSVESVTFSKNGLQLASGDQEGTVRIWDTLTGVHISTLASHSQWVYSVVYLNGGIRLASGSGNNLIQLWDAEAGRTFQILPGDLDQVHNVVFSGDGSRLACVSRDNKIHVWDAQTGALVSTLSGAAFSFSELISVLFLDCDVKVGSTRLTSLLLLVKREIPLVTGLIKASIRSGDEWEIDSLCWFPPDMEAHSFVYNQSNCRVAVGCKNGRVMVLDFSSEKFCLS